jgi:hypothetical protein
VEEEEEEMKGDSSARTTVGGVSNSAQNSLCQIKDEKK